MVQGAALIIAGCAINYIPIRVPPWAKDAVSITLNILSLLGCWFGFSLIIGPSLFQRGWEPLLFTTGIALLGWSFRIIIRSIQVGKLIPLIAGFVVIFPAMTWIQLGSPVIAEAWISLVYGLSALTVSKGIKHFVQFSLGYAKMKKIFIPHIVYGTVSIGLGVTCAGYFTYQSELMYLNIAGLLMVVGFGYFLFMRGYHMYQDFKNQPEMTKEERERILLGFDPGKLN